MEFSEPNREFVEHAITEVLKVVRLQGITPEDFIYMLDSGMRISDFLNVADISADGRAMGYPDN